MNLNDASFYIFGLGYTGKRIAKSLMRYGIPVRGTQRKIDSVDMDDVVCPTDLFDNGFQGVDFEEIMKNTTHIIVTIPPCEIGDPVLNMLKDSLHAAPKLRWIGYLSSTSVYGETDGVKVDEHAETKTKLRRGVRRVNAEAGWMESGLPIHIFRLPGIYGPRRGPIQKIRNGKAIRIRKPGFFFNRIHVDDIANAVLLSASNPSPGSVYNILDDEPEEAHIVTSFACGLMGLDDIPLQEWDEVKDSLSPMARSFYIESKILSNSKMKRELGVRLIYPTYREGLKAQLFDEHQMDVLDHVKQRRVTCLVVNIGSKFPTPTKDLRKICCMLKDRYFSGWENLRVLPVSMKYSESISKNLLDGFLAENFVQSLRLVLTRDEPDMIIVLPLFLGESKTVTKDIPAICSSVQSEINQTHTLIKFGKVLVDISNEQDDRVARMLYSRIEERLLSHESSHFKVDRSSLHIIIVDHGTPSVVVNTARELIGKQMKKLMPKVKSIITASMESRTGDEFSFNEPLLENAFEKLNIYSGFVIISLMFLSAGRHAGPNGDIQHIVDNLKLRYPDIQILVTDPVGPHPLVANIAEDRLKSVIYSLPQSTF